MSIVKHLVPRFIKSRYFDIKKRLDRLELSVRGLESTLDALVVSPKYVQSEDTGFNGQRQRKAIFSQIISAVTFQAIVETGTWLGNTTGFMAQSSGLPVYSCELNSRFHALAKMRLADLRGIRLELCDSPRYLEKLAHSELTQSCVFFYLDAHWYEVLPLVSEVDIISSNWKRFAIMIDDFKVPDDPGYTYDDYPNEGTLELGLFGPGANVRRLAAFFPSAKASEESGAKRGCVVLAPMGDISETLANLSSLRRFNRE